MIEDFWPNETVDTEIWLGLVVDGGGAEIGTPAVLVRPGERFLDMLHLTWYRCESPERPEDPHVVWHYRDCRGCRVAAEALGRRYPGDSHVEWLLERIMA